MLAQRPLLPIHRLTLTVAPAAAMGVSGLDALYSLAQTFDLVEAWYSLEQYIGFEGRQAFIHYCGLHQV